MLYLYLFYLLFFACFFFIGNCLKKKTYLRITYFVIILIITTCIFLNIEIRTSNDQFLTLLGVKNIEINNGVIKILFSNKTQYNIPINENNTNDINNARIYWNQHYLLNNDNKLIIILIFYISLYYLVIIIFRLRIFESYLVQLVPWDDEGCPTITWVCDGESY